MLAINVSIPTLMVVRLYAVSSRS